MKRTRSVIASPFARRTGSLLVCALLLSPAPVCGADPGAPARIPGLDYEAPEAELGEVFQGDVIRHAFRFTNPTGRTVRFTSLRADVDAAKLHAEPEVVPAGGSGRVVVEVPATEPGRWGVLVRAETDYAPRPFRLLHLTTFVQSAYDPESAFLQYGAADRRASPSARFDLASRHVDRLEVLGFEAVPRYLEARVLARTGASDEGVRIGVTVRPNAPLGDSFGTFRVRTNVPEQPSFFVRFAGSFFDDVVASESPVSLGAVHVGETFEKSVTLTSRTGAPVRIERIESLWEPMKVTEAPCAADAVSCRELRLRAETRPGMSVEGTVRVWVSGQEQPIPLRFRGIVLGERSRVKDLGELAPAERAAPEPSVAAPGGPAALVPPGPPPATPHVRLTWSATREANTFGYLVFRAERREGPFRRRNVNVLRTAPGEGTHVYSFTDTDVVAGRRYFYYVESVDLTGRKHQLSGVLSREAGSS